MAMGGTPKAKLTCYVNPSVLKAMRYETVDRSVTLGQIVEEVYSAARKELKLQVGESKGQVQPRATGMGFPPPRYQR